MQKKKALEYLFCKFLSVWPSRRLAKKVEDKCEINFLDILNLKTEYQRKREEELYPVDKELFLHYMDLWGVEIEGYHKEEG